MARRRKTGGNAQQRVAASTAKRTPSTRQEIVEDLQSVAAGGKPGGNRINEAYAAYRARKEQEKPERAMDEAVDTWVQWNQARARTPQYRMAQDEAAEREASGYVSPENYAASIRANEAAAQRIRARSRTGANGSHLRAADGGGSLTEQQQALVDDLMQRSARSRMEAEAQAARTAAFRGSDYWLERANELEAKNRESRSSYGGMMQGGTAFRETPEFTRAERQELDRARENYYYTKNAERWGSMPEDLRQKALEAAGYTTDSVLAWQDGDEAALAGMTPDQRAQIQRDQRARRNQIAAILAGAGYEPEEVIEYASRVRNAERMQQEMAGLSEDVTGRGAEGVARGVYGTVQSYATNLLSPIGSVGLLAQKLFRGGAGAEQYRPVDYNTPSMYFSQGTSTIRGAVGGQMGDVGRFVYDTVNSAVDSGVRMLVGQALGGGLVPDAAASEAAAAKLNRFVSGFISTQMSGEVFANSFVQAKESGSTDADALLDSVTSAVIEGLTEKYSVESILKNPNGLTWTALRNSFLSEGSEEMASDFLNTVYDELKNGDDSELRTQYRELLASGATENDAFNRVFGDYVKQVVLDGLAGGLSGIAMSGAAEIGESWRYGQSGVYSDPENAAALVQEALELDPENRTALAARGRVEAGAGLTGRQAKELTRNNDARIAMQEEAGASAVPTADEQLADELYRQYGETAGAAAAQQNEDLAAELQREYGPVYRQNRQAEKTDGKTDYRLQREADGSVSVIIDANVLEGKPQQEWKKAVQGMIRKIFRDGVDLPRGTVYVNKKGVGEFTNGSYTRMLEREDPQTYQDKMRMSAGLEGIVQNSGPVHREAAKHDRSDDIVAFNRGDVRVTVRDNAYRGDVLTAIYSDGKETFFDINNLQRKTEKEATPHRETAVRSGSRQVGDASEEGAAPERYVTAHSDFSQTGASPNSKVAQRRTFVKPSGGTPVAGTDIVRVEQAGEGGLTLLRADGSTADLSAVKTAGTALEVLRAAEELPEYKDPLTLNGMLRAYEGYLGGGQSSPARAEDFLDSYAIALTAGAEGESRSVLAGITEDGRLRSAMETGYRRGAELSRGKRLAQHLGSAGAAALEEHGYRYPEEFGAFYQAGQEGLSFPEAKRMAGVSGLGEVRKAVFTAAWEAGRKDGNDYEETSGYDLGFEDGSRYAVSDDGGQRAAGVGARGQAGAVEEGAGGSESREGGRVGGRGAGHEGARTDLKKLGVASGTDAAQRVVRRERHDYGGEVITVSDRLEVYGADGKKTTVQAISTGKDVILREGDPMYGQHRLHELEHVRQRSMTDEEITAAFKEKTKDLPDGKVRSILRAYALDYYGLYGEDSTTMGDLYREYLADRAAGIPQKETDKAVRLPDERNAARDQRRDIYAMRGNQTQENFTRDKYYDRQIDRWSELKKGSYITVGTINEGSPLNQIGISAGKLYFDVSKIRAEMEERTDPIAPEIMKGIPEVLENPIIITEFRDRQGKTSASVYGKLYIKHSPVVVGVLTTETQKGVIVNKVQTIHAKRNFMSDITPENILYLNENKKETRAWFQSLSAQMPPLGENKSGLIRKLAQDGTNVKQKNRFSVSAPERDSAGRELSAEQAEYFKDSKVRDKDGNLLVMYHQTDGAFTVFDTKHDGAGARDNETPFGIFLKTTDRDIGVRGKNQMALYANITNPLHAENRADLVRQLRRLSPEYDRLKTESGKLDAEYGKKHEAAKKAFVDFLVQWRRDNPTASRSAIYDDPEFNAVYDAEDNVVTEWQERQTALDTQAKEAITEALRKNGYDGVILARDAGSFGRSTDAYIALDANQVKNPDNLAPTENPDIRYSVSEEAEPASSAEYAQMQRGRAPAGPSEREAAEQRKRQVTLLSHMTERAFELRRQFTEGTQRDLRTTDIPDVASDLLRFAGRKAMGRGELEQRLSDIAMKAARSQNPMEAYQVAKEEADYLAADMMRNATGQTDEAKDMWDGIRQTLRSGGKPVKLAITGQSRADLEREGGYEHLRKRLMGYAFLSAGGTPVDVFYEQELTPRFPTAFPDTIQNPADQLIRIVEVLDRFRQIFKSPWAGDAAEDTELLSQEIMQRLYNANVQAPSAEAYAAQREEMLQAHYEQRIAETRQRMQTEMENLRRSFDEKRQGERTARQEQKDRDALLHLAQRLDRVKVGSQWKAKAAELVGNLDTIAKSMTGRTILGDRIGNLSADGIETVGEDDLGRKYVDIETLRDWVREMQAQNPDFMPDRRTMEKIGRLDKVQIADMDIGDVRTLLNAMQNLENEMRTSRKLIDAQDKRDVAVQTAETVSDIESARGVRPVGVKKAWSDLIVTEGLSPVRFLHRVTGYNDEDPLYRAAQALQKGETKMHDYARRAEAMFRGFMEDKAFMGSLAGPKARTIEVTGLGPGGTKETVKITPDMQIAIFLHSFNNDNVRHAERGGFVVPDYDLLRKGHVSEAYNQGTLLRLRRSQMRAVQQNMTEREVQFARAIYRYFNTMSRNEINEVSRKLLGYDIAGVKNYYPIETNRKFGSGDPETVKRDGTIEGMGFMKSRQGAAGPINLRGAVDTLTKSIDRHGKYVGLAIPVRNFGKLYGNSSWAITPTEEEGATAAQQLTAQSLKWVLNRKWGEEASRYIDKLMGDIQNPSRNLDSWARNMAKIRSSYAGSVLTMNASVAVKQAASYPTAAAVVGWQPLIKAMTNWEKSDINFIAEHTPLLWYRSKGFSTQELGDMAKGKKQIPKGLNWIQGIDVATVKKLWKAAEYYVRQEQPELELRSDAYWDAVTEIYERIVLETQPDYTTMERPQLLRSENTLMQNLAMFKTQPFQNFNIAYDALANLQAKERQLKAAQDAARTDSSEETQARLREAKQNLKNAKKGAARAVSALVISAGVFSAMTLLWNIIRGNIKRYRDDDKNEINLKTIGEAFLSKTFWSDTAGSLAGILPFGSDAYEVFAALVLGDRYYGMEALTPSAISDFLEEVVKLDDTVKDLFKVFKGDAPVMDTVQTANRLVTTASKLFGAPIENVENIGKAVSFWAMKPFMRKEEADYWYRYYTQKTTAQGRSSADKDDIYAAYRSGNTDGYRSMRDAMEKWVWQENEKYQSGEITREEAQEKAAERMDGAMRDRIKEDLLGGGIDRKTAEKLLRTIGGQDEEKARESVDAWLYRDKSGNQEASAAQAGAYYAFAEPAGLSTEVFAEAWDFKQNVEGDKDSSGKTVPGSAKQKVVEYIQGLGLSREQEKALWDALKGNWKDTDTPWE